MRILLVSSYLPFPLHSGGHIRLYNIIKELSKRHEITLVCEKRNFQSEQDIEEVKKFCKILITVPRRKQWSFSNILKSGFSTKPFLIVGHENKEMKEEIKKLLASQKFDLIHVETSYVFQNLPKKVSIPVVLTEHNIEYLVYKRYAMGKPAPFKLLLELDILKLKVWEEKFWRKADCLVAVSSEEGKIMNADAVVPNGVDTDKFQISNLKYQISNGEKRVLFIGDFKWLQNRDSVEMILKDIWPKLNISEKLWIVGRKIPDYIKKIDGKNVIFDENSPSDTYEIYKRSKILLAPIRVGGGTSFKILESMASGVPVITTELGNAGIGAVDGQSIILAKTGEEFSLAIKKLREDKNLYEKISKNGRALIEEKYSWDKIVLKLEGVYRKVLNA